jgi:hypothetical protein
MLEIDQRSLQLRALHRSSPQAARRAASATTLNLQGNSTVEILVADEIEADEVT